LSKQERKKESKGSCIFCCVDNAMTPRTHMQQVGIETMHVPAKEKRTASTKMR
jgi:hypothetical protein